MKLGRLINAIAALILVFCVALIASPLNAVAAPSSYQQTCSDISLRENVLSAICRKRDQSPNQTAITLKGIENIDGTLKVVDPQKTANFNLSCTGTSIEGAEISSQCRKINGQFVSTRTGINGIENIDGVLKYTSTP
ncbi:MAG: CVNH domain-containing protein [Nostoc sp. DedVER02]|uniref:CVNH domain-containing protein n=1 Tax=unclassified Nostoc TaxID=2593658 RepID=UPI002AD59C78|nr:MULTISPECIES: CVNH domain-containing protein [unclassified Nostoc]MDZ7985561.1 CVNH domain-containing protein [Nostoc sp. DedVER02]MDZ8115267.1 CVNH domain-containing protein [Nostoc sp. DedVER01b]